MHLHSSTYNAPNEALELSERGPAAIPESMHFPLRQLPLVGLEHLRLRTIVSELPKNGTRGHPRRRRRRHRGAVSSSERLFLVSCPLISDQRS